MLSWSHTVDILCEFDLLCVWLFVRWQNFGKELEPLNSHKKVILLGKHWKDCSCVSILVCFGGNMGASFEQDERWWESPVINVSWKMPSKGIHPATCVPWSHQTGGGKLPWCNVLPWDIGLVTTPRKKGLLGAWNIIHHVAIKLLVLEECDNTWCYTPVWPNMDSRRVTPPKKCKRLNHVSSRVCTVSLFTTGQKNIILEGFPKSTTRFKSRNSSRGLSPALCSLRSFSVTFQVDINNPVQFTPFFLVVRGFHKGEKPFFNAGWRSNCQEPLWRMTILQYGLD